MERNASLYAQGLALNEDVLVLFLFLFSKKYFPHTRLKTEILDACFVKYRLMHIKLCILFLLLNPFVDYNLKFLQFCD